MRLFLVRFQQAGSGRWRGNGGELAKFIWVLNDNRCLFSPIQWLETRSCCKNRVCWKPSVQVGDCGFFVLWYQLGPMRVMISNCSPQVYRCLYLGESYCFAYWHCCAFFGFNQNEFQITIEKIPILSKAFFRASGATTAENLTGSL